MSFRVELTAGAYADLDRLMAWLKERSSAVAADRLSARFHEVLDRLGISASFLRPRLRKPLLPDRSAASLV